MSKLLIALLALDIGVSLSKVFNFQAKLKTLERLTPISKANKAISNLLIF